MNIYELAFASYIYSSLGDFDKSYKKFNGFTHNNIDINSQTHRQALIKWLNTWGCRNFYKKYHELASQELLHWYKNYQSYLPQNDKNIWELTLNDLDLIEKCYNSLIIKIASHNKRKNGETTANQFGHTPSSKILFALRPKSLIPWDGAMRKEFKQKYKITTYKQFLIKVMAEIDELKISCQKNNFRLEGIPAKLNKSYATIPKLIDEYHWITITRNCKPPDNGALENWIKWNL